MSSGHEAVAAAITRRQERHLGLTQRDLEFGEVRVVTPKIKVELDKSPAVLEQGQDFKLSQFLEWWHLNYGIRVGDTLLMLRHASGERVAFDVDSDRVVTPGIRQSGKTAYDTKTEVGLISASSTAIGPGGGTPTITLTWNHHIVKAARAYDANGNLIGYVPIFSSLP